LKSKLIFNHPQLLLAPFDPRPQSRSFQASIDADALKICTSKVVAVIFPLDSDGPALVTRPTITTYISRTALPESRSPCDLHPWTLVSFSTVVWNILFINISFIVIGDILQLLQS
jgi:hypothetical protein